MRRSQQLPGFRLGKVIDVDVQSPCLNDTGVGPGIRVQSQATTSYNSAARAGYVGQRDVECALTHMQQLAAVVLEAGGRQGQVLVGGFHGAVTVVEHAADLELCLAGASQGAQLAALVIDGVGGHGQVVGAFDQAVVVGQLTIEAKRDLVTGNLAGAVFQGAAIDAHQALGIQRALLVIEGGNRQPCIAGLRAEIAALIIELTGIE